MSRLVSKRVKRTSQTGITSDRYEFLGLEQAEPNLGDPLVGPSSVGANPIKAGTFYQLAAISQYPGERFWSSPVGIGTTLGVISVYANDILPNSAFSRIHGLNFVGTGVTLETPPLELFDGIGIATVRFTVTDLIAPGNDYEIPYHNPSTGLLAGANNFVFRDGNVGIGTSLPTQKLDVNGSVNISNNLNISGVSTLGTVRISSGVVTATSGIITYYGDGIGLINLYAEYAKTSGISTSVIGGIASVTSLNVTGISTLGNLEISSGIVTATSGIVTYYGDYFGTFKGTLDPAVEIINATTAVNVIGGIGSITQLRVSGISTFTDGPVLIGSGTSTGTSNQRLQITGGAYISGNLGIGTTNPATALDINGDITITGNNPKIYGNFGGLPLSSRLYFQSNIENQPTSLAVLPNGTNRQSNIAVFNRDDPNNSGIGVFDILDNRVTMDATARGTGIVPIAQFTVNGRGITVVDGGNVGIGTTNPESKLHITSSGITTGEALQVDGNIRVGISTTSNYIAFRGTFGDGVNSSGGDESFTAKKYTFTYIGERLYAGPERSELLLFKGNDTTNPNNGPDRIRLASTGGIVFDTVGLSTFGLFGSFEEVGVSTLLTTRMTITPIGNIGIGTTDPTSLLDVNGSTRLRGTLNDINNLPGTSGQILQSTGSGVTWVSSSSVGSGSTINIVEDNTNQNQYLTFVTGVGDTTLGISTNIVFNPSTGNLGIGTTNPTSTITEGIAHKTIHLYSPDSRQVSLKLDNANTGGNAWLLQSSAGLATNGQGKFAIYDYNNQLVRFTIDSGGNIGIGTTNPTTNLHVVGIVTATEYYGTFKGSIDTGVTIANATYADSAGIATNATFAGYATTAGISTVSQGLTGTPNINVGIVTATEYYGTFKGSIDTGVTIANATYADSAGIATNATFAGYATTAGIATNLGGGSGGAIPYQSSANITQFLSNGTSGQILQSNGGTNPPTWVDAAPAGAITGITIRDEGNIVGSANSVSQLNFTGSIVTATSSAGIATISFLDYVSNSGISTSVINGIASVTSLNVTGISTLGTVRISSGIITATSGIVTYYGDGSNLSGITASAESVGLGTTSTPQFAALGLGTAAVAGWELTMAGGLCQLRQSVTISGSTYTLDVQAANEFVTAAAINGATTINLSNLNTIPTGYVWRGVLSFQYTSGTVTWFGGNTGYAVKWDGGSAPTLTASEVETVIITVVGGGTTIEVAPLKGRA